ncbi:hypothetical protein V8E55_003935 [Tylopilus felleus]
MVDGQDIATKHPRLATDRFRHCSDICRILSPRLGISIGERGDRAWHKVREQFHSDDFDLVPLCINMAALTSSQIAGDVRLVCAITFSSYFLLVWDYLLTLDDEMTFIWESPSSFVKYLFIGNRYVNLLMQPINISQVTEVLPVHTNAACLGFSWAMACFQFWSYGSMHVMVLLRIWILHGRTRKINIVLTVMITLYLCAWIAALVYILSQINFDHFESGKILPPPGKAGFFLGEWLATLDIIAHTETRPVVDLGHRRSTAKFSRISPLVRSPYKHAIILFLANTLSDTANIIAWLPITLVNITGIRLAIDLRRLHILKEVTRSEISREVEIQMAAFDNNNLLWPKGLSTAWIPEILESPVSCTVP